MRPEMAPGAAKTINFACGTSRVLEQARGRLGNGRPRVPSRVCRKPNPHAKMNGIKQTTPPDPVPGRGEQVAGTCSSNRRSRRCWPLAIAGALMVLALALGWHENLTLGNVVTFRDRFHSILHQHRISTLIAYIAAYVCMTALSLPGGLVLTVAGGLMFGW